MNALILAANKRKQTGEEMEQPVCLSEVNGEILLEALARAIKSAKLGHCVCAFAMEELDYWNLDAVAERIFPNSVVVSVERPTAGALCTALLAAPYIDNDDALLIMSANELIRADLSEIVSRFKDAEADAGVICFDSAHPRYAYAKLDDKSYVTQVAERRPISRDALAGIFWFRSGRSFVQAARKTLMKDNSLRGVFYVSSTLNELILAGMRVAAYKLDKKRYMPLKTERLQEIFENSSFGAPNENS